MHTIATIAPQYLSNDGLVIAFYGSYEVEATDSPTEYAREIVSRHEEGRMWNWPSAVADALDELSTY